MLTWNKFPQILNANEIQGIQKSGYERILREKCKLSVTAEMFSDMAETL